MISMTMIMKQPLMNLEKFDSMIHSQKLLHGLRRATEKEMLKKIDRCQKYSK